MNNSFAKRKTDISTLLKNTGLCLMFTYIFTLFYFADDPNLTSLVRFIYVLTLCVTAMYALFSRKRMYGEYSFVIILVFILYIFMSILWTGDKGGILSYAIKMLQLFSVSIMIAVLAETERDFRLLLRALLIGGIFLVGYTYIKLGVVYIFESISNGTRVGLRQFNTSGLNSNIAMYISLYFAMFEKKRLCYIPAAMAIILVIASASRQSFIIMVVGLVLMAVIKIKNTKLSVVLGAVACIAVVFMIVSSLIDITAYTDRLGALNNLIEGDVEEVDGSLNTRMNMLELSNKMLSEKPFLGHGLQQFQHRFLLEYGIERPPHSTYMQMFVSFGLIGGLIYYSIHITAILRAIFLKKRIGTYGIIVGLFSILMITTDIALNMMYNKFTYVFIGLICAYFVLLQRENNDKNKNQDEENNPSYKIWHEQKILSAIAAKNEENVVAKTDETESTVVDESENNTQKQKISELYKQQHNGKSRLKPKRTVSVYKNQKKGNGSNDNN